MKSRSNENNSSPNSLSILFEFTESGYPRSVLLNANSDKEQEMLRKALDRLIKPSHLGWLRRLLG